MKSQVLNSRKEASGRIHVWKQIVTSWKRIVKSIGFRFNSKIEINLIEEDLITDLQYGVQDHPEEKEV